MQQLQKGEKRKLLKYVCCFSCMKELDVKALFYELANKNIFQCLYNILWNRLLSMFCEDGAVLLSGNAEHVLYMI